MTRSRKIPIGEDPAAPDDRERSVPGEDGNEAASSAAEATGLEEVPGTGPSLQEELEAARKERDELRDEVLRRRAEFENYRRRVERDRHTAAQEALASVFREVVGTVDNLERALSAGGGPEELRKGVELTYRELMGLLEAHDVVVVDPVEGEPFDPTVHQALLHEPVPGFPEGSVAEVLRKGYSFGERLLRPALVKVAKSAGSAGEGGAGDGEEQ
ncbi:MAG: nucleotide exchange factor GrpE [Acidobacteria bacterium]|nr:nucleotide exchange factor GrpE [Acidobacteriota bacterium]